MLLPELTTTSPPVAPDFVADKFALVNVTSLLASVDAIVKFPAVTVRSENDTSVSPARSIKSSMVLISVACTAIVSIALSLSEMLIPFAWISFRLVEFVDPMTTSLATNSILPDSTESVSSVALTTIFPSAWILPVAAVRPTTEVSPVAFNVEY